MEEILQTYILGGSLIAGAKYVAQFLSPALAPLVAGMPTGIMTSFFLSSDKHRRKYYSGYVYSSTILTIAIILAHLVITYVPDIPVNAVSAVAIPTWAVMSYMVIQKEVT